MWTTRCGASLMLKIFKVCVNVCIFTLFNHLYLEKRKKEREKDKWCLTLSGCLRSINSLAGILYTAEAAVLMGYLWMFLRSVYSYLEGLPLSCQCLYPMCLPGLVKVTQQTTLAFSEFKWAKWAGELPKSHLEIQNWLKYFPNTSHYRSFIHKLHQNICWD